MDKKKSLTPIGLDVELDKNAVQRYLDNYKKSTKTGHNREHQESDESSAIRDADIGDLQSADAIKSEISTVSFTDNFDV